MSILSVMYPGTSNYGDLNELISAADTAVNWIEWAYLVENHGSSVWLLITRLSSSLCTTKPHCKGTNEQLFDCPRSTADSQSQYRKHLTYKLIGEINDMVFKEFTTCNSAISSEWYKVSLERQCEVSYTIDFHQLTSLQSRHENTGMSLTEKEDGAILTVPVQDAIRQQDNDLLATLGYKPEFKREFSVRWNASHVE